MTNNGKRVMQQVLKYYCDTTGNDYIKFLDTLRLINLGQENLNDYSQWLVKESLNLLNSQGVTLADIMANKDVLQKAVGDKKSRDEGEFYTPEVWCVDGREYLKKILGDKWGKVIVWDCAAGGGNLMATADYPADKLFLSTLLEEDVAILKERYPGATCFQLDFLADIDMDKYNTFFSDKLPERLRQAFINKEEIVFYINPPYKAVQSNSTAVGQYMNCCGLGACASDLLMQFFYRIMSLKEFYKHNDITLALFSTVTLFTRTRVKALYELFRQDFKFIDGMCFSAADFSGTSDSIDWIVSYTVWKSKEDKEVDKTPVILTVKKLDENGVIQTAGIKHIRPLDELVLLKEWVKPKDVERYKFVPSFTWYNTAKDSLAKIGENAMGALMSRHYGIDGTRRCAVTNATCPDGVSITKENFWRVVASFAARRLYAMDINPFNNCQYYAAPDTTIEGYDDWVLQCLPLFLFDYENMSCGYRDVECAGQIFNIPNTFFPIDKETVRQVVKDEAILADIDKSPAENEFVVEVLKETFPKLSEEGREFTMFCMQTLLESLSDDRRKQCGYPNWLVAWDSALIQLRQSKSTVLWSDETNQKYTYLLNKYKKSIEYGLYKYGFMFDYNDMEA